MAGMGIEPMTVSDLAQVLAEHDQFWDGRDVRFLHHSVFVREFGDTCLTARGAGGRIEGYLLGLTTPHRVGYIHVVAVRAAARGAGHALALYRAFAAAAAAQGADRLKAVTTEANTASIAFHRRLGFEVALVEDYSGPGTPRAVMTRSLPLTF
jgi:ribosomal protein S18 acetylase RimI-like enzyme